MNERFQREPSLRIFLSTDAGGVGVNLQRANMLVNIDLPWNPAMLDEGGQDEVMLEGFMQSVRAMLDVGMNDPVGGEPDVVPDAVPEHASGKRFLLQVSSNHVQLSMGVFTILCLV